MNYSTSTSTFISVIFVLIVLVSVTTVESTGSLYLRVLTFVYTYVGSYQFDTVHLLAVQEVEEDDDCAV